MFITGQRSMKLMKQRWLLWYLMMERAKHFYWKEMVHWFLLGGGSFLSAGLLYCCALLHFFYATWTAWVSYFGRSSIIASKWSCTRVWLKLLSVAFCTTVVGSVKFTVNQTYTMSFICSCLPCLKFLICTILDDIDSFIS